MSGLIVAAIEIPIGANQSFLWRLFWLVLFGAFLFTWFCLSFNDRSGSTWIVSVGSSQLTIMSVVQVEEWRPWALLLRENNDFPCLLNAFSHGMFIVSDRYLRQPSLKSCINCPICHSEDSTSFNTPISICLETPLLVKDWLIRTLIIASNFDLCRGDFQNHYCHYEYFILQVLKNLPTLWVSSTYNKGWSHPWVARGEGPSPH